MVRYQPMGEVRSNEVEILVIEFERELDGRWIASAPESKGEPSVYGGTRQEALQNLVELLGIVGW